MIAKVEALQAWLENVTFQMCNMSYKEQSKNLAGYASTLVFDPLLIIDKSRSSRCSPLVPQERLPMKRCRSLVDGVSPRLEWANSSSNSSELKSLMRFWVVQKRSWVIWVSDRRKLLFHWARPQLILKYATDAQGCPIVGAMGMVARSTRGYCRRWSFLSVLCLSLYTFLFYFVYIESMYLCAFTSMNNTNSKSGSMGVCS